jgi:putative sporulation protein YyaC
VKDLDVRLRESSKRPEDRRVSFDDPHASLILQNMIDTALLHVGRRQILVVCVGTDRSTGDAFGPIIGSKLLSFPVLPGVDVVGTLDEPVHAVNLASTLETIRNKYVHAPYIIAVDACLGKFDHVGQIVMDNGPLRPGAGVNKTLPAFGDLTLTGIVNVSGFMEYFVLQNTRLSIVIKMSDVLVRALRGSLTKMSLQYSLP